MSERIAVVRVIIHIDRCITITVWGTAWGFNVDSKYTLLISIVDQTSIVQTLMMNPVFSLFSAPTCVNQIKIWKNVLIIYKSQNYFHVIKCLYPMNQFLV